MTNLSLFSNLASKKLRKIWYKSDENRCNDIVTENIYVRLLNIHRLNRETSQIHSLIEFFPTVNKYFHNRYNIISVILNTNCHKNSYYACNNSI